MTEEKQPQLSTLALQVKALGLDVLTGKPSFIDGIQDMTRLAYSYHRVIITTLTASIKQPHILRTLLKTIANQHLELSKQILLQWRQQPFHDIIKPDVKDRRFRNQHWKKKPLLSFIKQSYLINSQALLTTIKQIKDLDPTDKRQAIFCLRIFIEAISPSNNLLLDPDLYHECINSQGKSLLQGLENFLYDLKTWRCYMNITKTQLNYFRYGKTIATTPGKIVYQNKLFQLIQYTPTTDHVYKIPLLVTASWINKYYILDLRQNNSLLQWIVNQGITVFVISWVNPDSQHRHFGFSEYMQQGILTAIEKINQLTHLPCINCLGYCLGGTLLASTIAYLQSTQQPLIHSASLLGTLIDFTDPGEVINLMGEEQINIFADSMQKCGYWDGRKMVSAFNLVAMNDYIWPYFINNYCRGNIPLPHDVMYWSQDVTNIPAPLTLFYMRSLHQQNLLIQPGAIKINGQPLNFADIDIPLFFVNPQDDELSPWKSAYQGALLPKGPVEFILTKATHVSGILNPPTKTKYGYYQSPLKPTADKWFDSANFCPGSWWPRWMTWLQQRSGETINATSRVPNSTLEDAPGSYAQDRLIDR